MHILPEAQGIKPTLNEGDFSKRISKPIKNRPVRTDTSLHPSSLLCQRAARAEFVANTNAVESACYTNVICSRRDFLRQDAVVPHSTAVPAYSRFISRFTTHGSAEMSA